MICCTICTEQLIAIKPNSSYHMRILEVTLGKSKKIHFISEDIEVFARLHELYFFFIQIYHTTSFIYVFMAPFIKIYSENMLLLKNPSNSKAHFRCLVKAHSKDHMGRLQFMARKFSYLLKLFLFVFLSKRPSLHVNHVHKKTTSFKPNFIIKNFKFDGHILSERIQER